MCEGDRQPAITYVRAQLHAHLCPFADACNAGQVDIVRSLLLRPCVFFPTNLLLIVFFPRSQLGSSEMNEAICDVVTGHGERVVERFRSPIREFAAKIRWGGKKDQ